MNKDNQILKNNLSSLLKKFAKTNFIEKFDDGYQTTNTVNLLTENIIDNRFFKNVILDEKMLTKMEKDISFHGLVSPLLVRPIENGKYEIVAGRKRLICARKLNIRSVVCMVHNFSDENMLLYMLFNAKNETTKSVIEMATICQLLCKKFHYTQATIAELLDMSRSQITNLMRILQLPKRIQREVSKGRLSYGHARAIAGLSEDKIDDVVNLIYEKRLSVRDTEYLVNELKNRQGYDYLISNFEKRNNIRAKINGKQLILSFKTKKEIKKFIVKK
ncbi:MAG: ParB/RepB/Spo0J family partition protein [Erysipelotrichales bacterium]|nr:ParB/RepB/Spo0J family partition protein [Erysipelotrichales bacterium]